MSKKIVRVKDTKNGWYVDKIYTNIREAYRDLNLNQKRSDISKVLNKNQKKFGYYWLSEMDFEILNEKEKEYLKHVIKPFRDKVDHIIKWSDFENDNYLGKLECINIVFKDETMEFPCFPQGTMYKGMEAGICYSIEELGL